ncbi:MAG: CYTH domain-containing protein [Cyanobacteria bacterium P01_D01_bin.105]
MAKEIERKFLVLCDRWQAFVAANAPVGKSYCQGYIATVVAGQSVRVRIAGDQGFLTIKGPSQGQQGLTRTEFEYDIPVEDAQEMLETLCERPFIAKIRYRIPAQDVVWEVDEFQGDNAGLMVAEVELTAEEQLFARPSWLGEEVSGDAKYYNSNLVKQPYRTWARSDARLSQL